LFDILVYLVENYFDDQICPDPAALELKLKAAGFDGEDIDDALQWLSGLAVTGDTELPLAFAERASFRSFAPQEIARLSTQCRGLIAFLESSGVIDPLQRELIIERSLALPDGSIDVDRLKIITLVVLWSTGAQPDALVFEELLPDQESHGLH
jgi:Smg protein